MNMNEWHDMKIEVVESGHQIDAAASITCWKDASATGLTTNSSHTGGGHNQQCGSQQQDSTDSASINTARTKYDVLQDITHEKCHDCFLQPCVTYFHQSWLVAPKPAQAENTNTGGRKTYTKFWSTMNYRGGWQEPNYQAKMRELQKAGYCDETTVWATALGSVQREIMPECVLTLVRSLHPNPPEQPYTGHRWN